MKSYRQHMSIVHKQIVDCELNKKTNSNYYIAQLLPPRGNRTKDMESVIHECVNLLISPAVLARKYRVNRKTVTDWVKKAGLSLPKKYRIDLSNCRPPPENKTQNQLQICPAC